MDEGRCAALRGLAVEPSLSERQLEQLASLLGLLESDRHAPTAVRAARDAMDVHLADSLSALELEGVRSARRVADIGAGAGFPGLPLAVARPDAELALVESQRRKCEFIERAAAQMGMANVTAVCARAEQWRAGMRRHDLVVARAVAAQPVVLEYAAPLLARGGLLVDWRGARDAGEEAMALAAAAELGLELVEVRSVKPFAASRDRSLHVYSKVRETPDRFPRRPGAARKKPLGAGTQARP